MASPLIHDKVWLDKHKYDAAECQHYEKLAKPIQAGFQNSPVTKKSMSKSYSVVTANQKANKVDLTVSSNVIPFNTGQSESNIRTVPHTNNNSQINNKHSLPKKTDHKGTERKSKAAKVVDKGSSNTPLKSSLAGEVAKARQHIKDSLKCMDGIETLSSLSNQNQDASVLKALNAVTEKVSSLEHQVNELQKRVKLLETSRSPSSGQGKAKKEEDEDDGVDLFGSDSEEETAEAKKVKEDRLAAYAAKKSKKPVLIAKSNIILDVKPWSDETDMALMEQAVRKINCDGLLWGASKLVPLAYGIHKLQISCVVEDDKVSIDWLQETLEEIEDYVQSVDIAAFNKV